MTVTRRRTAAAGVGVLALVAASLIVLGATASATGSPSGCPVSRVGSAAAARSPRGGPEPFQIKFASLCQDGQQLVWQATLEQPVATNRLAGNGRTLCLLLERVASGVVWGQACVLAPTRHSQAPRLVYMPVTGGAPGHAQVITATVGRTTSYDLTATFLPATIDLRYGPIRWQTISTLRSPRCARGTPGRAATAARTCSVLYPAKPSLLKLHSPVLVGCIASGSSLVFHGPSGQREIALTFDDGPWNDPPTADFLAMLEREHVPATFFEIGDQISTYDPGGALERRMLRDGDMVGDHTWTHPLMTSLRRRQQRFQLVQTLDAIRQATHGFTPCLWRPPGGAENASLVALARSLGLLTVMWDVDPRDWALPGVGAIYSNVVAHAHNGAIVIQHFGGGPRIETLAAVPKEISALRARGYRFVTVTTLLGLQLVYQ